jgi:hypothetical protein
MSGKAVRGMTHILGPLYFCPIGKADGVYTILHNNGTNKFQGSSLHVGTSEILSLDIRPLFKNHIDE